MGMNKPAAALLVKTLTPTITKFAESGKLDGFFKHIKSEAAKDLNLLDSESVEIMITTEADDREYVSLVILENGSTVGKVLRTMPLADMIIQLLSNI